MKQYLKLFLPLGICTAVCCTLMIISYDVSVSPSRDTSEGKTNTSGASITANPDTTTEIETAEVSTPNRATTMYILKYNAETDTVFMITKKEDGTELISPVESINTTYLTPSDIEALTKGIELTSREDMFILIEDYSS
ncbi:MAG: hypothetical protein J6D26_02360 [Clostridia bacterium]|nr:hypothetical protein [Clostridia bacterium]